MGKYGSPNMWSHSIRVRGLEKIADDLTQLSFALTLNRLEESVKCYLSLKEHLAENASNNGNAISVANPFRILSDR